MSSLWTPGGERPVPRSSSEAQDQPRERGVPGGEEALTEDEARQMADLRERMDQLAATPAEVVVANHAYGLSQLAALHLSLEKPQLDQARLAIDAFGCLVEGLGDRLGEPAADLREALAQLRMAFVQIRAATAGGPGGGPSGAAEAAGSPGAGQGPAGEAESPGGAAGSGPEEEGSG